MNFWAFVDKNPGATALLAFTLLLIVDSIGTDAVRAIFVWRTGAMPKGAKDKLEDRR